VRCLLTALELAKKIVNALEDKKGENIVLMDMQGVVPFTDFFIICSGTSDRMLNALSDAASDAAKQHGDINARLEGKPQDGWLLVDCGDVVIHLFSPDQRSYYRLEQLWEKSKVLLRVA
jgi:ribosome-associated protein